MKPDRKCETCSSLFTEPGGQMFCRNGPPQVTIVPLPNRDSLGRPGIALQTMASWPPVQKGQWCLSWAPDFAGLS
jgi:hypothetical protein